MKAQIRMIIASVIVIALALTAVSGITYSWFSDTEQSDITITTGKIDLDAEYSGVKVRSYGDADYAHVDLNDETGTTTTLNGNVKATATDVETDSYIGNNLAITFTNAAPGDEITFKMAVTLVNTIYVTYKQSIIIDSDAPFTVTGFDSIEKSGVNIKEIGGDATGINTTAAYMLGSSASGVDVTIKFKEGATVSDYGDKQYTIILAVQAIQMNVASAEIAATKTISLGTATADTVLEVKSAESTANIKVTLPKSTTTTDVTASSVSVTAKALTASQVKTDSSMSVASSAGTFLAGVEITRSVYIVPGTEEETQQYFKIEMNVGELSTEVLGTLKVYHGDNVLKEKSEATVGTDEYYEYADGVVTIYALEFSPFVVVDGTQATIGSARYASLAEAIGAINDGTAPGSKITLLKDASYSDYLFVSKDATLNLNGHQITFTGDYGFVYTSKFTITGDANSKVSGSGYIFYGYRSSNADLTIDGGTYVAKNAVLIAQNVESGVGYCDSGKVTIKNGTFTSTGDRVLKTEMTTVQIDGGEFNSEKDYCIYSVYSNTTINGGTFNILKNSGASSQQIIISEESDGTITINGGTFNGISTDVEMTMVKIGADATGSVGVNGGEFNLTISGSGKAYFFCMSTAAKLSVAGGSFEMTRSEDAEGFFCLADLSDDHYGISGSTSNWTITLTESARFIEGGEFNFNPSSILFKTTGGAKANVNFVADGYKATEDPDGTWTVDANSA